MSEKIIVRKNAYTVLKILAESESGELLYDKYCELSGYKKTSFAAYISQLRKGGMVKTEGSYNSGYKVVLICNFSDVEIGVVSEPHRKQESNSKPISDVKIWKRLPCMTCREPFDSEGPHNRMCATCLSALRTNASPSVYEPLGDGNAFNIYDAYRGLRL